MNTQQSTPSSIAEPLSQRLKKAYERVSPKLRPDAVTAFSQFHRIHPDTFRKKRNGDLLVTEQECEWMEAYRPSPAPNYEQTPN